MQNFSPFPLRARGSLEIFDAAIKLYKQYFWVLLGWSAIVTGASVFGALIPLGSLAAIFLTPLSVGSVVCCMAAAVRGHSVEFGQCWRFTQPRYWMVLGMYIVASIVAFLIAGVLTVVCVGIVVGGAFAFQSSPLSVQIVMGVLAFLVFGVIGTVVWTVSISWVSLVPIVVCMEEDKRGTTALHRAYDILKGHWLRITTLMALVGLGMLAIFAILAGAVALIVGVGQIGDLLQGNGAETLALWLGIAGMGLAYLVLAIVCTPLYYLILTVFYLDVRVRQEALDLEWTAHVTTPVAPAPSAPPGFIPTPVSPSPEYSATGFSSPALAPLETPAIPAPAAPAPSSHFETRLLSDEPSTPVALPETLTASPAEASAETENPADKLPASERTSPQW